MVALRGDRPAAATVTQKSSFSSAQSKEDSKGSLTFTRSEAQPIILQASGIFDIHTSHTHQSSSFQGAAEGCKRGHGGESLILTLKDDDDDDDEKRGKGMASCAKGVFPGPLVLLYNDRDKVGSLAGLIPLAIPSFITICQLLILSFFLRDFK